MSPHFGRDRSETCTVLTAGSAVVTWLKRLSGLISSGPSRMSGISATPLQRLLVLLADAGVAYYVQRREDGPTNFSSGPSSGDCAASTRMRAM